MSSLCPGEGGPEPVTVDGGPEPEVVPAPDDAPGPDQPARTPGAGLLPGIIPMVPDGDGPNVDLPPPNSFPEGLPEELPEGIDVEGLVDGLTEDDAPPRSGTLPGEAIDPAEGPNLGGGVVIEPAR